MITSFYHWFEPKRSAICGKPMFERVPTAFLRVHCLSSDVRRLVVAMSRARLGLYIFGRVNLFER